MDAPDTMYPHGSRLLLRNREGIQRAARNTGCVSLVELDLCPNALSAGRTSSSYAGPVPSVPSSATPLSMCNQYPYDHFSHPFYSRNLASSLIKDLSAWQLVMDWAQDKMGYVAFDSKIREFGPQYVHEEWKPLINAIFAASDPHNEEAQLPSALVEEAMRTHGVSLVAPIDWSSTQSNSSRHAVQCHSGNATWKSKRRKINPITFLDIAAEDNEHKDDAKQGKGGAHGSRSPSIDLQPSRLSGKETFSHAIDAVIVRYDMPSHQQDSLLQTPLKIPEGISMPLTQSLYIVDLFSGMFTQSEWFIS